jgi:amino-acid N-acetyltransferase
MLRPARISDVAEMAQFINSFAQRNLMLPRPLNRMYENLRDYTVIEEDGKVVGCGALHILWYDLAEVRSVAVREGYQGRGYGKIIVDALIEEARELGVYQVFMLVLPDGAMARLALRSNFREVSKDELPHKVWSDCLNCPKFTDCDEIALITEVAPKIESPHQWSSVMSAYVRRSGEIEQMPIPRELPTIRPVKRD